jgi:hypothetical protein
MKKDHQTNAKTVEGSASLAVESAEEEELLLEEIVSLAGPAGPRCAAGDSRRGRPSRSGASRCP